MTGRPLTAAQREARKAARKRWRKANKDKVKASRKRWLLRRRQRNSEMRREQFADAMVAATAAWHERMRQREARLAVYMEKLR
jgi:hypothetical protein